MRARRSVRVGVGCACRFVCVGVGCAHMQAWRVQGCSGGGVGVRGAVGVNGGCRCAGGCRCVIFTFRYQSDTASIKKDETRVLSFLLYAIKKVEE